MGRAGERVLDSWLRMGQGGLSRGGGGHGAWYHTLPLNVEHFSSLQLRMCALTSS